MKTLIEKFFNNTLISMVILSERFTACQKLNQNPTTNIRGT